jgi:spore coat polysaccharide biosynthesis predicted glycosyltransferase SpsG
VSQHIDQEIQSKEILIYAEGSPEVGFGHLYRMKNLTKSMGNYKFLFLTTNEHQEKFYSNFELPYISSEIFFEKFSNFKFKYFMVDSKLNREDLFKIVKASKKILFDSLKIDNDIIDLVVIPSFFFSPVGSRKIEKSKCMFGPSYVILNPMIRSVKNQTKDRKLVISFGGSDPNNISLKLIKVISKFDIIKDVNLILGPGYKHSISELKTYLDAEQIFCNPKNIFDLFNSSYLTITALGTTVQELRYLNIPTGIIYNYPDDKFDIGQINEYFNSTKKNNHFFDFGHFDSIKESYMIQSIVDQKKTKFVRSFDDSLGSAWEKRDFLNSFFSH